MFSVTQLRIEMSQAMVTSGMLSGPQLTILMTAPNIDAAVNGLGINNAAWTLYWNDLDARINGLGGNIIAPTASAPFGLVLPPVLPPNITAGNNMGLRVILNDCFDDTWGWMAHPNFSPAQALANHIRLLRL